MDGCFVTGMTAIPHLGFGCFSSLDKGKNNVDHHFLKVLGNFRLWKKETHIFSNFSSHRSLLIAHCSHDSIIAYSFRSNSLETNFKSSLRVENYSIFSP